MSHPTPRPHPRQRPSLLRTATRTFICTIAATTLLAALVATQGWSDDAYAEPPPPTYVTDAHIPSTPYVLTQPQRDAIAQRVLTDPRVVALLADHQHTIVSVREWSTNGIDLGAAIEIHLPTRPTISGNWFALSWPICSRVLPPPVVVTYRATYAPVTRIYAFANTATNDVLGLIPNTSVDTHQIGKREYTGIHRSIKGCKID